MVEAPGARVTRSKPRSLRTGWAMLAAASWTYSWTTSSPMQSPVLVTVTVTSTVSPSSRRAVVLIVSRLRRGPETLKEV